MLFGNSSYNIKELRGLACILLVAYHVVGVPGAGMQVDDTSWYRYVVSSFELIRMPLFTFLSGLVYAHRPASSDRLPSFFGKKARRLLIPFVTVSTLYYIAQDLTGVESKVNSADSLWAIYFFSYAHFWYLQSLCLIFLIVAPLDAFKLIARPLPFAAAFAAAILGCLTIQVPANPFSVDEAFILLPHFMLGMAVTRFPDLFRKPQIIGLTVTGLILALAIHQTALLTHGHGHIHWNSPVALLCGMCGALVLLRSMPSGALFRRVGGNSYSIYLYHAFFTAGARVVLKPISANELTMFLLSLMAGLAGPILVEALASPRPFTRVALVGKA